MIRTSDFDYHLPPGLIAQTPLERRDSSRLLVLHRDTGHLEHRDFPEIIEYLRAGDVMVFNQSRVIPARLHGHREDTGGKVELLLLRREGPDTWQALARPGRRLRPGVIIVLDPPRGQPGQLPQSIVGSTSGDEKSPLNPPFIKGGKGGFRIEVLASHADGIKTVRLAGDVSLLGEVPLPPYIHQRLADPERYQTVYNREEGSAAAPTAGLHFTQELLDKIKSAGVELAFVTLHVGLDTFRPVQHENPAQHQIHTEYYEIPPETAGILNRARADGRRVIAVGTTSVRVLEQAALDLHHRGQSQLEAQSGWAGLFILPGYKFQLVDAMVTNFHLPRSTLLMLVSAFVEAGRRKGDPSTGSGRTVVLAAYQEAMTNGYRFYSFGDAMLIH